MDKEEKKQQHYYFKTSLGRPYEIKVTYMDINTEINTMYREMSKEQTEFYISNPDAGVMEVWECRRNTQSIPSESDIRDYAENIINELKITCQNSISVTNVEFTMAIDKIDHENSESYYSKQEAERVVEDFRSQSKHAMQTFEKYRPMILEAGTIEEIDRIYKQAIDEL